MTGIDVDDIGAPPSHEAWKPAVNEVIKGTILYVGSWVGENFDGDGHEKKMRLDVQPDDGTPPRSVYCVLNNDVNGDGWPDRMAKAISAGARAAGATRVQAGDTIAIQRLADGEPSRAGMNPPKQWNASYRVATPAAGVDLLGAEPATAPAAPAAAPAPAPAAPAAAPATGLADLLG